MDEQFELPLPEVPDHRIYFEDTCLTADVILAQSMQHFQEVFVIGVDDEGFKYNASNGDARFWIFALERAKSWLLQQIG